MGSSFLRWFLLIFPCCIASLGKLDHEECLAPSELLFLGQPRNHMFDEAIGLIVQISFGERCDVVNAGLFS